MSLGKTLSWSLLLSLFVLSGCRKADDVWPSAGKKRVLVSFAPLYCFTKNVAGDDVDVRCLLTSQGPHDFTWKANEVLMVQKADLILINGLGLDEQITTKALKKGTGNVAEVGEAIPDAQLKVMAGGEGRTHEGHEHKAGGHDPHVWLGPPQAKEMVAFLAAKLGELDPTHKKNYLDRADAYSKELDQLHEYGKEAFKKKKSRNIVATHDSLQYFADAFGLKVVGNIQPRAGIEADARKLLGLVKICKDEGVSVIAVEPQYSEGPAEALQKQLKDKGVDVKLVEVDPLETAPAVNGNPDPKYYMKRMYDNIDNLARALQ